MTCVADVLHKRSKASRSWRDVSSLVDVAADATPPTKRLVCAPMDIDGKVCQGPNDGDVDCASSGWSNCDALTKAMSLSISTPDVCDTDGNPGDSSVTFDHALPSARDIDEYNFDLSGVMELASPSPRVPIRLASSTSLSPTGSVGSVGSGPSLPTAGMDVSGGAVFTPRKSAFAYLSSLLAASRAEAKAAAEATAAGASV